MIIKNHSSHPPHKRENKKMRESERKIQSDKKENSCNREEMLSAEHKFSLCLCSFERNATKTAKRFSYPKLLSTQYIFLQANPVVCVTSSWMAAEIFSITIVRI